MTRSIKEQNDDEYNLDRASRFVATRNSLTPGFSASMDQVSAQHGEAFLKHAGQQPSKITAASIDGGKSVIYEVGGLLLESKTMIESTNPVTGASEFKTVQRILNPKRNAEDAKKAALSLQIDIENGARWFSPSD